MGSGGQTLPSGNKEEVTCIGEEGETEDGAAGGRREGSGGLTGSLLLHPARFLCSVLQLKQHQFKYVSLIKMKHFIQIRDYCDITVFKH